VGDPQRAQAARARAGPDRLPDVRAPAVRHGQVVADIERRLERYEDPIEVAVLGCEERLVHELFADVDAEAAAALRGPERAPGHTKVHMRSVQRHTRRSHWGTGD
jgi:hypothetical protein